jgi:Cys-tRNA(Pro) deacylase
MEWPEPVERVAAALRAAAVPAELDEFATRTETAVDAAAAIGCSLDQIVKSLLFVGSQRTVLALVPGDRRADPAKVARAAGEATVRIATAAEVRATTGVEPGAVAPIGLGDAVRVLLERNLLAHEWVWIGAGSPRHLARLAPRDLLRAARAEPADLVSE